MSTSRKVRIYGEPRPEFDVELMVQILLMLGRELYQQAANSAQTVGISRPAQHAMSDLRDLEEAEG